MDDHPPGGFDRPDLPPNVSVKPPEVYNIPLRSLYSKNVNNLLLAGRNISASHVAFTSTRVMGTCSSIGQAAGTAAALCRKYGLTPRALASQKNRVFELQQMLLRDDATLSKRKNEDPLDLARRARVSASAERDEAKAEFVLDGFTRDIPNKQGHHWAARMSPDGAWIELSWEKPQWIREIQITFDSGFQRELTLTSSDSVNAGIVRAAQPETVRDYTVSYRKPGAEERIELAAVKGNHQRLRRHRIDAVEAAAVRVHVHKTNGDDFARIFEIRCYA
jgi:hypothetical protein